MMHGIRINPLIDESFLSARLLGLNERRGNSVVISIRMRRANDERHFFPFEHLLGTALHEMAHIGNIHHNSISAHVHHNHNQSVDHTMRSSISCSESWKESGRLSHINRRPRLDELWAHQQAYRLHHRKYRLSQPWVRVTPILIEHLHHLCSMLSMNLQPSIRSFNGGSYRLGGLNTNS